MLFVYPNRHTSQRGENGDDHTSYGHNVIQGDVHADRWVSVDVPTLRARLIEQTRGSAEESCGAWKERSG
jgi:hypothetical protein